MLNLTWTILDIGFWRKIFHKSFLICVLLFLYIPMICFVLLSFSAPSEKGTISPALGSGSWAGVDNYVSFFTSRNSSLMLSLENSIIIAIISIPISLFIGLLTTISIWKNYGRGSKAVFLCCNLTISCPDIIQAIAFALMFSSLAIDLGFFSVILTHIALQIPYVVIFLYPKLHKLKLNLLLASHDLNFRFFESIIHVIIPSLWPNILLAALTAFTISFDDYIITNLVRGSVTTVSTELYSMKTGIQMWASVFGSLVMVFVTGVSLLIGGFNFVKQNRRNG